MRISRRNTRRNPHRISGRISRRNIRRNIRRNSRRNIRRNIRRNLRRRRKTKKRIYSGEVARGTPSCDEAVVKANVDAAVRAANASYDAADSAEGALVLWRIKCRDNGAAAVAVAAKNAVVLQKQAQVAVHKLETAYSKYFELKSL